MRIKSLTFALATALGLLGASSAQAAITLNFNPTVGSTIQFAGTGTSATISLQPQITPQFVVTSESGNGLDQSGLGITGSIIGSGFTYQVNQITTSGLNQSAPLSGSGTITLIAPVGGETLTATISGGTIGTTFGGVIGGFNATTTVNLSNLSLVGSGNVALTTFYNQAISTGGITTISWTFIPGMNLTDLAANSTVMTAYSGRLTTAVPEPGTLVMAFMAVPLLGVGIRKARRRTQA